MSKLRFTPISSVIARSASDAAIFNRRMDCRAQFMPLWVLAMTNRFISAGNNPAVFSATTHYNEEHEVTHHVK
jgi:hypothetical protein